MGGNLLCHGNSFGSTGLRRTVPLQYPWSYNAEIHTAHAGKDAYLPAHRASRRLLLVANHVFCAVLKVFSFHTPHPLTEQSPSKKQNNKNKPWFSTPICMPFWANTVKKSETMGRASMQNLIANKRVTSKLKWCLKNIKAVCQSDVLWLIGYYTNCKVSENRHLLSTPGNRKI